jgi:hypothetical protein
MWSAKHCSGHHCHTHELPLPNDMLWQGERRVEECKLPLCADLEKMQTTVVFEGSKKRQNVHMVLARSADFSRPNILTHQPTLQFTLAVMLVGTWGESTSPQKLPKKRLQAETRSSLGKLYSTMCWCSRPVSGTISCSGSFQAPLPLTSLWLCSPIRAMKRRQR